jgi:hypothetical protein
MMSGLNGSEQSDQPSLQIWSLRKPQIDQAEAVKIQALEAGRIIIY